MFNPFKFFKKKEEGEEEEKTEEASEDSGEGGKKTKEKSSLNLSEGASGDLTKISTEIDRLNASVESFGEVRKSINERMSQMSEQIGELRAMILDRDRSIQEIELKSVKAADLVEAVQPEKLMIEVQREDAKFEALKANLESNEAIMDRVMDELKGVRKKLEFFRGIEEVLKLSEEVRKELIEIKKVEVAVNVDSEKVQTMYLELRKKFQDIDEFKGSLQELKANLEQSLKDIDTMKNRMARLADKDELDSLVSKVQTYIDELKDLNKKSAISRDLGQLKKMLDSIS